MEICKQIKYLLKMARRGPLGPSLEEINRTPIEDFKYTEEGFVLRDFVDKYRFKLPVVVHVAEGFCSPDEGKFTFSFEDTYWISHIKKQKRIIGKSEDGLNFSIPYDHSIKFTVHEDGCEPWGPLKLEDIFWTQEYEGDKTIYLEPTKAETVTVWQGADNMESKKIKRLQLIDVYEETYLVGSPVIHKFLYDHRCPIPVFVPIKLAVATDVLSNKKQKAFEKEMIKLKEFTAQFPNQDASGNPEIMIFTDDQVDEVDSDYEHINPYNTIGEVQPAPPGHDGSEEVTLGQTPPPPQRGPKPSPKSPDGRVPAPAPAPKPQQRDAIKDKIFGANKPNLPPHRAPKDKPAPRVPPQTTPSKPDPPSLRGPLHTTQEKPIPQDRKILQPIAGKPENPLTSNGAPHAWRQVSTPITGVSAARARPLSEENVYSPCPPVPPKSGLIETEGRNRGVSPGTINIPGTQDSGVCRQVSNTTRSSGGDDSGVDANDYEDPNFNAYFELQSIPQDLDFKTISKIQVGLFLRLLKLGKYEKAFFEQDIDGELLLELDREMLMSDFKLSGYEATKLIKFVRDGWRSH